MAGLLLTKADDVKDESPSKIELGPPEDTSADGEEGGE